MKKLLIGLIIAAFLVVSAGIVMAKPRGYNDKARVFVGTGLQWCMQKFDDTWGSEDACRTYLGIYVDDHLKMKWNAEWERGNAEGWSDFNGYHGAWSDNQWNGMAGGSGETWHYMNRWIGPCNDGESTPNGGYCIWGEFEVAMSHGTYAGEHIWDAHAIPAGVGVEP